MASEQRTIGGEATPGNGQDEPEAPAPGEADGAPPAAPRAPAPTPAAAAAPARAPAIPAQRAGVAPPYAPTPRIGIPTQAVPSSAPAPGRAPEEAGEGRASDSSPPPESGAPDDKKASRERKNRFEALLPGIIRRGLERSIEAGLNTFEKSLETGRETTGAVREALNEVKAPRDVANAVGKALSEAKLPRELASAVLGQLDDTKNDVLRILAREFREFLDSTDVSGALKEALTSLSFEVRTEIRFIPNEAGEGVKADVRARSRIKRNNPPPPRERRRRSVKKQEEEEEESGED
jgi:hypothetical protein